MSATIYYQPVKGKALSIGAPSSFLSALQRAFGGDGARVLTEHDVPKLEGLAAGIGSDDGWDARRRHSGSSTNPLVDAWEDYRATVIRTMKM